MPGQSGEHSSSFQPSRGLEYLEAYQFAFQSPNWLTNLLMGALCQFVPLIGPVILVGYEYEVVEALHRDPRRLYPDFILDRFGDYLKRGIWPALVAVCVTMVMIPIAWIFMLIPILLAAAGGQQHGGALAIVGMLLMMVIIFVMATMLMMLITPMMLRAGLSQDFSAAFDMAFIKDFLSRMWVEVLLAGLFLIISSNVVMFAGLAFFCVGIYPAGALVAFAQTHLQFQLYEIYLQRGGQPISLKQPLTQAQP